VRRAAARRGAIAPGSDKARTTAAAMASGEKKSTSRPFTPSWITSCTGAVAEPTTKQPQLIASSIDQDRTKGYVR
jgi:hypothetical protein